MLRSNTCVTSVCVVRGTQRWGPCEPPTHVGQVRARLPKLARAHHPYALGSSINPYIIRPYKQPTLHTQPPTTDVRGGSDRTAAQVHLFFAAGQFVAGTFPAHTRTRYLMSLAATTTLIRALSARAIYAVWKGSCSLSGCSCSCTAQKSEPHWA